MSVALVACAELTEPGPGAPPLQKEPASDSAAQPSEPQPSRPDPARAPAQAAPSAEQIGAAHVLIAYKGALRAAPTVTRSKAEAQKLAGQVAAKARAGQDFGALATQFSDDPSAKRGAGSLGKFARGSMVKPFSDAAFALKPGQVSSVVETDFGFHVIKRTE